MTRPPRPHIVARVGARVGAWFRALPVASKLALFPALTAGALAAMLLLTIALGLAGERRLARLGSEYYPTVQATMRLDQLLPAIERALQDAVGTGDAEHLARADALAREFERTRRSAATAGSGGAREREALGARFAAYYAAARAATVRLRAGEVGGAMADALRDLQGRHRRLRDALAARARADQTAMTEALAAERLRQRLVWVACLGVGTLTVAGLAALSRVGTRALTLPLYDAVRAADRVADGDLTVELPEAGPDEVGRLLRSMARMVANLRDGEERLVHQATHDALTGLPNRVLFRERVARARAAAGGGELAVLYVDLDDFKTVNDSLGHEAGDRLLVAAADRLLRATRGCDTVARLGGDEFAVLLRGLHHADETAIVAERIVRALATPFRVANADARVAASVGIALGAEAPEVDDLLRHADLAMYAAKQAGKGRYRRYAHSMQAALLDRIALERDLERAIAGGELRLHYQPLVDLATGRIVSAEALVRWPHPTRGMVPPAEFIPIAERSGLVVALGRWALDEACRQAAAWSHARAPGAPRVGVGVNVSGWQIQHPGLVEDVRAALARHALPPDALTLEITESALLADTDATLARLHALRGLGVSLAVDDFGTGYSSLAYLHRFPVNVLKIDKAFVDGLGRPDADASLARAVVAIGGALGMRTVAEGIEEAAQAALLRALGCQLGQGFLFARPMPGDELTARLTEERGAVAV